MIGFYPYQLKRARRRECTGQENYYDVSGVSRRGMFSDINLDVCGNITLPGFGLWMSYDTEEIGQLLGGN